MKRHATIVELLSKIQTPQNIYEMSEAKFYSRLNYDKPGHITITLSDEPAGPYFKAELTDDGKRYLQTLQEAEPCAI